MIKVLEGCMRHCKEKFSSRGREQVEERRFVNRRNVSSVGKEG